MTLNWKTIGGFVVAALVVALVIVVALGWASYNTMIGYTSHGMMGRWTPGYSLANPLWWLGRLVVPLGILVLIVVAVVLAVRATSKPAAPVKQEPMCYQCGQLVVADWKSCPYCGVELAVTSGPICPKCGKSVQANWNYCPSCNAELP